MAAFSIDVYIYIFQLQNLILLLKSITSWTEAKKDPKSKQVLLGGSKEEEGDLKTIVSSY
jgi:hypothetical protein